MVRTDRLRGSGTIRADGAAANGTVGNDASGGGGAGGAVMVSALDGTGSALSVSAVGGNGGTNTPGGSAHGPGGGGGGGFVATNFAVPSTTSGGAPGLTENGGTFGASYGSTSGNGGSVLSPFAPSSIPGTSSSAECTPVIVKAFAPATIGVGQTARLSVTVRNRNPTLAMTATAFTDTYPTQITNALVPNSATACGGTVTAVASGPNVALAGGSLAAASSCIVAVDVVGKAAGDWTNTIAAGGLTVVYGTQTVGSLAATSAILKVAAPLTATKSNVAYWDPYNLFANPKAIPGSIVTYTITVTNPTGSATDPNSVTVSDMIPVNTKLIVTDYAAAGSGPVAFVDGAPPGGLAYAFGGLASATDGLQFSTQASPSQTDPAHWAYIPSAGPGGVDPAVTFVRVKLTGTFAAAGTFSVKFRAVVR